MLKVRASSLGQVMASAQSIDQGLVSDDVAKIVAKKKRSDEEKALIDSLKQRSLSAGAKTFVKNALKREILGYTSFFDSRYTEKGTVVEDDSIALFNTVNFCNFAKNTEHRENQWVTGTCDIDTGSEIIDIKSAWSLETFPFFNEDAMDSDYEWQVRAYMMLWDRPKARVVYCMVDTPDYLQRYESEELHIVSHIDPFLRVTEVCYDRDLDKERQIIERVEAMQAYYLQLKSNINKGLS